MTTATLSALEAQLMETPEYKALVANFQAQRDAVTAQVKANGYTFSDGTHLDYPALVLFCQTTLAVKADNSPKSVFEAVSEARAALGSLYPTKNKWKGLQALLDAVK